MKWTQASHESTISYGNEMSKSTENGEHVKHHGITRNQETKSTKKH